MLTGSTWRPYTTKNICHLGKSIRPVSFRTRVALRKCTLRESRQIAQCNGRQSPACKRLLCRAFTDDKVPSRRNTLHSDPDCAAYFKIPVFRRQSHPSLQYSFAWQFASLEVLKLAFYRLLSDLSSDHVSSKELGNKQGSACDSPR